VTVFVDVSARLSYLVAVPHRALLARYTPLVCKNLDCVYF